MHGRFSQRITAQGRSFGPLAVMLAAVAFAACLFLLPEASGAAHVPSPARYEKAKADLEKLYKDARRSGWREPWQKLAETFLDIYEKEKDWVNRPAALFRSALSLDELARRSFARKDAQDAVDRYLLVADRHKTNPLADDALLAVAKLQAERLDDVPAALKTVDRLCSVYPKSEECREGRAYAKQLSQPAAAGRAASAPGGGAKPGRQALEQPAKPASQVARISSVNWDTSGQVVRIELNLDKAVAWELRSQAGSEKTGTTPGLALELDDARPDASVTPGAKISGSSLKRVRLDYHKSNITRLLLDYSRLGSFSIREEADGTKLIIETAIKPEWLPGGLAPGSVVRSPRTASTERRAQASGESSAFWVATHNLASQFGLNVRTVVIDPGHGGKDPGTHHNRILEREVALDLAQRLGKLLAAQGFDVKYTRTGNSFVSLSKRAEMANREQADLFVSLHINASPNKEKSGFETYFLGVSSSTAAASLAAFENMLSNRKLGDLEKMIADLMVGVRKEESERLARDVQQKTISRLNRQGYAVQNGGIRGAPFVVLLETTMPAILVEAGYCTNPKEAKLLATPAFRNALAQGIADGILAYAERLRNGQGG